VLGRTDEALGEKKQGVLTENLWPKLFSEAPRCAPLRLLFLKQASCRPQIIENKGHQIDPHCRNCPAPRKIYSAPRGRKRRANQLLKTGLSITMSTRVLQENLMTEPARSEPGGRLDAHLLSGSLAGSPKSFHSARNPLQSNLTARSCFVKFFDLT